MAEYEYRRIVDRETLARMWRATVDQGRMPLLNPHGHVDLETWLRTVEREDVLVLGGYVDGEMGGYLVGIPFSVAGPTRCMEVAVCSFRRYADHAAALSRGGYMWCFDNLDCASLVGRIVDLNRHVVRMAPRVGFQILGKIPGLLWSERRQSFRDGYFVRATRETVLAAIEREE